MSEEAVRASIYVRDPDLVEYLNSIPPHKRSKHIRALIKEDMERNWTVVESQSKGDREPADPAPRDPQQAPADQPAGAGGDSNMISVSSSEPSDNSMTRGSKSRKTQPGQAKEKIPPQSLEPWRQLIYSYSKGR